MLRRFLLCWNHFKIFIIRLRIKEKVFHSLPGSEQLLVLRTSASIRRSVFRTSDRTDHSAERRSEASEPSSSRLASSDREPNPESAELNVAFTMCGKIKQDPSLYQPPLGSIWWLKLVICYIVTLYQSFSCHCDKFLFYCVGRTCTNEVALDLVKEEMLLSTTICSVSTSLATSPCYETRF